MNSGQKHKVSCSSKVQFHISGFGLIKERDRGCMRRMLLNSVFLSVLTVLFLSSGSSWAVIYISNITDLQKIGNDPGYPLDGEYELTQDIDASATSSWNGGAGFNPIGTVINSFTGKFDGKGHKITGLHINRPTTDYISLFGIGTGSEVKNLGIEDCQIVGYNYAGGIMSSNEGTVSGCYNTGSVSGGSSVGGLVGVNYGTVSGCYSTGSVSGEIDTGGLVGENYGIVSSCYSTGSVLGYQYVGGLLGSNIGTVSGCYSMGAVWGDSYVGGFTGVNYYGMVSNSYAMGSVTSLANYIGGLIGFLNNGDVTNTYSTGFVRGGSSNKGGLIGYSSGTITITSSYWDTETSGMSTSAGGEGKTTAEMKQQATYSGWDFSTIWDITEGSTYPWLRELGPTQFRTPVEKNISTLAELDKIGRDIEYPWDGIYHLTNDIDAGETMGWDGGNGFKPISPFTGKFYGHGYKIVNLYIYRWEENNVGLFGDFMYGEISDLGIEDAIVLGSRYVGGLVGWNYGTVSGSYSTGDMGGDYYYIGGLVGVNSGTVSGSYSTGTVSGEKVIGGLVGRNYGTVSGSYSTGAVSGYQVIGGLAGQNYGTVSGSYSMGSARGNDNIGGLMGENYSGTVSDSYAKGSVIGSNSIGGLIGRLEDGYVTNTYYTGDLWGSGSNIGGLIGYVQGSPIITSSYWDMETSGISTSAGGEGKTTAEMKHLATFVGWDFTNVWGIIENTTYPYLRWQYTVPDVIGMTQAEAESEIIGAGLTVGMVTEQCSDTVPAGSVISQDPTGGQQVSIGTTVELTVSTGLCPVSVPNVVGLTQAEAESAITGAGLTVGAVIEQCSNTVPAGSVISQDPTGGQQVSIGTTVELTVSTGLCPVSVPDVVGMAQAEAENTITGAGLTVGIVIEQCNETVPAGNVISQGPIGGEQVPPGTAVDLVVSTGPCPVMVPNVVGMTQVNAESIITGAGLTVGTVTEQCSDTVPAGNVISQEPTGGEQVPPGTAVNLIVSTGPCPEGEGFPEGEGAVEGEGIPEGTPEGEGAVEGTIEGIPEGTPEGTVEGTPEGSTEGEGVVEGEGTLEGEGIVEGTPEGTTEGEGIVEGAPEGEGTAEGIPEGIVEGTIEGEGIPEGTVEGTPDGEGTPEGEGMSEGEGSAEGEKPPHSADPNGDGVISLSELLRVIQFFNTGGYHCETGSEDGYAPGIEGDQTCTPHTSDYNPQDWIISLSELLRLIQFFNYGGYHPCPDGEDGYCPGL